MKLPKEINYVEAFLTLRCNLNCDYCINDNDEIERDRLELSEKDWIEHLNAVDFGKVPLTFGGGEPSLHRDFYQILQNIKPETKVDLLTNFRFGANEFIANTLPERFTREDNPAYKSIRVSYHVDKMNPNVLMNKVKQLSNRGYPVGIFGINHPHNIKANMEMAELARKNGVYFFVKDFLGKFQDEHYGHYKYPQGLDGKLKDAECKSKELLIAPDGLIYKCHRDLYHEDQSFTSVFEKDFSHLLNQYRKCHNFGKCNPCDLKNKTNRFFDMGQCQVDVRE